MICHDHEHEHDQEKHGTPAICTTTIHVTEREVGVEIRSLLIYIQYSSQPLVLVLRSDRRLYGRFRFLCRRRPQLSVSGRFVVNIVEIFEIAMAGVTSQVGSHPSAEDDLFRSSGEWVMVVVVVVVVVRWWRGKSPLGISTNFLQST